MSTTPTPAASGAAPLTVAERAELDQLRLLAGGNACIPEVQRVLGPISLWSAQALQDHIDREVAAALASPQVAPAVKPLDDPRLQQLFGDAIEGALMWGVMGSNAPSQGHWLARFWNIGRAESTRPAAPVQVAPAGSAEIDASEIQRLAEIAYEAGQACLVPDVRGEPWKHVGITTALVWMNAVEGLLKVATPMQAPAVADDAAAKPEPTYSSTQATNCAGCGKRKHTPLRIDAMGGYVCLTCIDQKLSSLLGEFGYPEPEAAADDARDAVRYRWLRDRSAWTLISAHGMTRLAARLPVSLKADAEDAHEMDAAIDAAMASGISEIDRALSTPAAKPAEEQA